MAYYWTCPDCGAHLDPGEKCGCEGETVNWPQFPQIMRIILSDGTVITKNTYQENNREVTA